MGIAAPASAQELGSALGDPAASPAAPSLVVPSGYGAPGPGLDAAPRRARPRGGYMPTWPILVPGLVAFLTTYGSSAAAGAILLAGGVTDSGAWLLAPVVGPLVMAEQMHSPEDVALFIALGVAQAAGLAVMIAGLAINRRASSDAPAVSLTPLVAPELAGLAASGRF